MKILLTGSSGMVGRNIMDRKNAFSCDLLTPPSRELNLLNYNDVDNYLATHKPDMIIHAAGKVGGIQANIANPINFLVENVDMGRNIIIAAKNNNIKQLLNLSSSCMYPRDAVNPLSENLILKGELEPTNEGYAIAKIFALKLVEYIKREDDSFNYKTIIPCNLFGKWDKFDPANSHMLPAVIRKIHNAKINKLDTVEIWGDGEARREFMFATDLADLVWYSVSNFDKMPDLMNIGLGHDFTINQYYKTIANVIGYNGDFVHDLSKPIGMKKKLVDIKKLTNFGWEHTFSLEKGIQISYDYFLEHYN
jgi:GDP-L-fucose synthase